MATSPSRGGILAAEKLPGFSEVIVLDLMIYRVKSMQDYAVIYMKDNRMILLRHHCIARDL